jgi:hypothetical protein
MKNLSHFLESDIRFWQTAVFRLPTLPTIGLFRHVTKQRIWEQDPMLNIRFHQNLSLSLLSSDAAKAEVLDF